MGQKKDDNDQAQVTPRRPSGSVRDKERRPHRQQEETGDILKNKKFIMIYLKTELMFEIDYSPKTLHIVIRNPEKRIIDTSLIKQGDIEYNGLIYNPREIYTDFYAIPLYEDFFNIKKRYELVPIETEQGPVELVKRFHKDFNVIFDKNKVGGIIAPFHVAEEQAKEMLDKLENTPELYFHSAEKDRFTKETIRLPENTE